ncbi:hypothetical protein RGF97_26345 [Streptomyces roseicoloratus]|uniref:Right handed beta helix domain-containing protein n=1 Tax=Streptomyces roseicoloratus TaxID=2508722 RepID=A0ABY9RZK9_9ACTN|nr:hypothetical protein [Streptomyces roseicoloratus]WMX47622.1 hypothetical protein RGF97_26345 [Streptomyces roseicoloratus]
MLRTVAALALEASLSRLAVLAAATGAVAAVVAVPATAQALEFVPCSATALRNAITRANTTPGPATLYLSYGCTYQLTVEDNPGNGLPAVTSEIDVIGNRSTIRRASTTVNFRIFEVRGPGGDLTLRNLTVRDGRSTSGGAGGGGIAVAFGSRATLDNVEVTRNQALATGPGGGIAAGGTLALRNSTVSYNIAQDNGGGVFANGPLTLSNTTVTGNTARAQAGGIDVHETLVATNSRVTDNSDREGAGGIQVREGAAATLTDTLVRGNTTARNSGGGGAAGGIVNLGSLSLERTTVFANWALGSDSQAGGIYNLGATASATLRNSSVTHNLSGTAAESAGGVYNSGGTVSLTATPVTDNLPSNCAPSSPAVAGCTG